MRQLFMKQKIFSMNEKFFIKDINGADVYYVEGSLFKIHKKFVLMNQNGQEVGCITKEIFKLLPKFKLEIYGQEMLYIEKEFTFFKAKYSIKSQSIRIDGDILDKNFNICKDNQIIGTINKKWLAMADTYEINVIDPTYEPLVVLLVAAIDYVNACDDAATAGPF